GPGCGAAAGAFAVAGAGPVASGVDLAGAAVEVARDVAAAAAAAALAAGLGAGALAGADAGADAGPEAERAAVEGVALDAGELGQPGGQVAIDDVVEDLAVLVLEHPDPGRLGRDVLGVGIARALGVALA